MATSGDPVRTGLIASLARPGGNITGSTVVIAELMAKRLELLKEAAPRVNQVAVLANAGDSSRLPVYEAMEATARSLKVELQKFEVRSPYEFESTFAAMAKGGVNAVVVQEESMLASNLRAIADLAAMRRVPLAGFPAFAQAGGLVGYGANVPELMRRAAAFVDRILKGAKPGDLPVEQPTKFELVINLKTAKALGINIPQSILLRADKVIE